MIKDIVTISVNSISTLLNLGLLAMFQDIPGILQGQITVGNFINVWFSLLGSRLLCRHKGLLHIQMTHCLVNLYLFKCYYSRIEVKYCVTGIGVYFTERLFTL